MGESSRKVHHPHVLGLGYCWQDCPPPIPHIWDCFPIVCLYTLLCTLLFSLTASPATQPHHCPAAGIISLHLYPFMSQSAFCLNLIPIWSFFPFAHLIPYPSPPPQANYFLPLHEASGAASATGHSAKASRGQDRPLRKWGPGEWRETQQNHISTLLAFALAAPLPGALSPESCAAHPLPT